MASQVQESILKAIDALVGNRIDNIKADKTVTATIVSCVNALTGEYKVSYNGGYITAYAPVDTVYTANTSVYVLVPEGDFSKTKKILDKASASNAKDKDMTFISSAINDYSAIGRNILEYDGDGMVGVCSYRNKDYALLYSADEELPVEDTNFKINIDELEAYINQAEALMIEGSFFTNFKRDHRYNYNINYGIVFVLAFEDKSVEGEEKLVSYVLDTKSMVGNPNAFTSWTKQNQIFPIDVDNFIRIDQIYLFCEGEEKESENTDDIFIKNLELDFLKTITAVNGDYKLKVSTPDGAAFPINSTDSKRLVARLTQKDTLDISDTTMFYWFGEDSRITASSDEYNGYGGAGWKWLKNEKSSTLFLKAEDCPAYQNNYLCVAVYNNSVIVKDKVSVYNDNEKRSIHIESNIGTTFVFDTGTPTLTCVIEEESAREEKEYSYSWCKVNNDGTFTSFDKTYEELEQEYNTIKESGSYTLSQLLNIKQQMQEMQNVGFADDAHKSITFPVKNIQNSVEIKCSVYAPKIINGEEQDVCVGTASITLYNEMAAKPEGYSIIIENGEQVFQYSESGVAPDNERYTDPIEVKNLKCHFFNPTGLEVDNSTYVVNWKFPTEDSLIDISQLDEESKVFNDPEGKKNLFTNQEYPLKIEQSYDYSAYNNQIMAIVTYEGQTYSKETNFFFTKIGDNGTNGTDVVAKIEPSMDIIGIVEKGTASNDATETAAGWLLSNGTVLDGIGSVEFNLKVYNRNELLDITDRQILWKMVGGTKLSNCLTVSADENGKGKVSLVNENDSNHPLRNQIIQAYTTIEDVTYYAQYAIPVIEYPTDVYEPMISIDKVKLLKDIVYDASGENPLYNKNQGIFLLLENEKDYSFEWDCYGGYPYEKESKVVITNPKDCSFKISTNKSDKKNDFSSSISRSKGENHVYVYPNDTFNGDYSNNIVCCKIYEEDNLVATVWVPIYVSLNRYGLPSLNAWDGTHIEINEDSNYILAPQVGAGVKNEDNSFTGIVMGKAETYADQGKPQIGLLGYANGKQSIFLNAEDGSAIFGLKENEYGSDDYNEGRIELKPRGTSTIGNWRIGSRSLYNITKKNGSLDNNIQLDAPYDDLDKMRYKSSIPHEEEGILLSSVPAYISIKGKTLEANDRSVDYTSANSIIQPDDSFELQLDPNNPSLFTVYRHTNEPDIDGCKFDIKSEGKDRYIVNSNSDAEDKLSKAVIEDKNIEGKIVPVIVAWQILRPADNGNTYVIGRSYTRDDKEQIYYSAVKYSGSLSEKDEKGYVIPVIFNIASDNDKDYLDPREYYYWRREAKVGINSQGRFYTNALKDNTAGLTIGSIGAFGERATQGKYTGAVFEVGSGTTNNSLIKMFTDQDNLNESDGALYISGGSNVDDEYQRPTYLYGEEIGLYAHPSRLENEINDEEGNIVKESNTVKKYTDSRLVISKSKIDLGIDGTSFTVGDSTNLLSDKNINISTDNDKDVLISSSNDIIVKSSKKVATWTESDEGSNNSESEEETANEKTERDKYSLSLTNDIGFSLDVNGQGSMNFDKPFSLSSAVNNGKTFKLNMTDTGTITRRKENDDKSTGKPRIWSSSNPIYPQTKIGFEEDDKKSNDTEGADVSYNDAYLSLTPSSLSQLIADKGLEVQSKNGGILIETFTSTDMLKLNACGPAGNSSTSTTLEMVGSDNGAKSTFSINCPNGQIYAASMNTENFDKPGGIVISPFLSVNGNLTALGDVNIISNSVSGDNKGGNLEVEKNATVKGTLYVEDNENGWLCLGQGDGYDINRNGLLWFNKNWGREYSYTLADFKRTWAATTYITNASGQGIVPQTIQNAINRAVTNGNNEVYQVVNTKAGKADTSLLDFLENAIQNADSLPLLRSCVSYMCGILRTMNQ